MERRGVGGSFEVIANLPVNAVTYRDEAVQPATTYTYRVRAGSADGPSAPSNEASATTPNVPAPAAPANLRGEATSSSSIRLTWEDRSSSEDGFKIQEKDSGGQWVPVDLAAAGVTQYDHGNLVENTLHTYRVIAFNSGGDSPPSNEATVRTPKAGRLRVEPATLDFGAVRTGKSRSKQLSVTNEGANPVVVSVNPPASPFSVKAGATLRLAPGQTRPLAVKFTPRSNGNHNGTLTIVSDDPLTPSVVVQLKGTGTGGR